MDEKSKSMKIPQDFRNDLLKKIKKKTNFSLFIEEIDKCYSLRIQTYFMIYSLINFFMNMFFVFFK